MSDVHTIFNTRDLLKFRCFFKRASSSDYRAVQWILRLLSISRERNVTQISSSIICAGGKLSLIAQRNDLRSASQILQNQRTDALSTVDTTTVVLGIRE